MKKNTLMGAAVLLAVLAAGAWWRSHSSGAAGANAAAGAASGPGKAQTVTLFTVAARDLPVQVQAAGTVVPLNTVEVRPQVSTTVRQVHIREGQFVREGDLLFTLDDRADRANLEKAQATLLRDQATLADLERQWRRNQELLAQNFVSQSALDGIQAQLEAQKALVASDRAAVKAAEVSSGYHQLRAPLSGRAGAINVHPGSLVQPSGDALVTISQLDPIGVSFTLPEAQLPALLGDDARRAQGLALTVLRSGVDGQPAEPLTGRLSFLDNTVDTTSGTIRLKGTLPNPQQALWPGQYVTVQLTLRTLQGVAVVPQAALIVQGHQRQAYVVAADATVALRTLTVLHEAGEWVAVDGVKPGEKVVLEGKQNLRPGAAVRAASGAGA